MALVFSLPPRNRDKKVAFKLLGYTQDVKLDTKEKVTKIQQIKDFIKSKYTQDIKLDTKEKIIEIQQTRRQKCLKYTKDVKLDTKDVKLDTRDVKLDTRDNRGEIAAWDGCPIGGAPSHQGGHDHSKKV